MNGGSVGQALSPANCILRVCALFLLAGTASAAQQHVAWSVSFEPAAVAPGGTALARINATIDPGWHLYAASSPAGIPATFAVGPATVVWRTSLSESIPQRAFDPNFNSQTETFEGLAHFEMMVQTRLNAPTGPATLEIAARFQTCNDTTCVPGKWSGTANLIIDPAIKAAGIISYSPYGMTEVKPLSPANSAPPSAKGTPAQPWALFLITAFGLGLASIFTPCCFPMIPITMSYFLNRQFGRRDAILHAVVFCLGIIVLFSALGLVITALLGPVGVVQLGASPWVNGFIAALFVVFSCSLLGAF